MTILPAVSNGNLLIQADSVLLLRAHIETQRVLTESLRVVNQQLRDNLTRAMHDLTRAMADRDDAQDKLNRIEELITDLRGILA